MKFNEVYFKLTSSWLKKSKSNKNGWYEGYSIGDPSQMNFHTCTWKLTKTTKESHDQFIQIVCE